MRELSRFRANYTLELGGGPVRWADQPPYEPKAFDEGDTQYRCLP